MGAGLDMAGVLWRGGRGGALLSSSWGHHSTNCRLAQNHPLVTQNSLLVAVQKAHTLWPFDGLL